VQSLSVIVATLGTDFFELVLNISLKAMALPIDLTDMCSMRHPESMFEETGSCPISS
jgi:hypothetical protein